MNTRQKRFADEYLIDLNATQAAIRAGYSPKTAQVQGARLLANVMVSAYIQEQLDIIHNQRTADAQEILEYLSSIMRGEKTETVLKLSGDGVQTAVEIAVSAKERIRAAELLGKYFKLFTDKVDLSAQGNVIIYGEDLLDDGEKIYIPGQGWCQKFENSQSQAG